MKKFNFNWRNKAFISGLVGLLLLGAGLNVPGLNTAITMGACAVLECQPVVVDE